MKPVRAISHLEGKAPAAPRIEIDAWTRPGGSLALRKRGLVDRRAFTLVEVLIAVALGASLMTAAIFFALSMGELWGSGSETRLFDQHVRGVTRFLENILQQAEAPPAEPTSDLSQQSQQAKETPAPTVNQAEALQQEADAARVQWEVPRGHQYGSEPLLTFELAESPGVFAWPQQPLPFVVCALRVDPQRGLTILWKSRLEKDFDDTPPREMVVSPYVVGMTYYYFDDSGGKSAWQSADRPRTQSGGTSFEVPARVRLTFDYHGEHREAELVLPGVKSGAPVF